MGLETVILNVKGEFEGYPTKQLKKGIWKKYLGKGN